jgi:hypothetical protein
MSQSGDFPRERQLDNRLNTQPGGEVRRAAWRTTSSSPRGLLTCFAVAVFGAVCASLALGSPAAWAFGVGLAGSLVMMWRRWQFGRWLAVLLMSVLSVLLGLAASWLFFVEGTMESVFWWIGAIGSLAAALTLVFSDSVGDMLGKQITLQEWNAVAPAARDVITADRAGVASSRVLSRNDLVAAALRRQRRGAGVGILLLLLFGLCACVFVGTVLGLLASTFELVRVAQEPNDAQLQAFVASQEGYGDTLAAALVGGFAEGLWRGLLIVFAPVFFLSVILQTYAWFFVAPFVLSLPVTIPFASKWRKPARVLVLRPFNRPGYTKSLARTLRRGLAGLGHIYTLADSTLQIPLYVRVPIVFGQISLFSYRMRKVRRPNQVYRVCRSIRRTWLRNLNWLFSRSKIFPIACNDQAWRAVVMRLICEVDVILVDVTGATENVIWELEQCREYGRSTRILFLVDAREAAAAKGLLSMHFGEDEVAERLLVYGGNDPRDAAQLRAAIADRLVRLNGVGSYNLLPLLG